MRSVQPRARAPGHAHSLAVLALDAHSRGVAFAVEQHHVGDMDRALALDHASESRFALRAWHRLRAGVALDHVQVLHVDALPLGLDAQHSAGLAAILARDHLHVIPRADLQRLALACAPSGHHSTSGASETIFMKLRSRSSRATGPNTRVPRGLFWSSMITAAFSSKAIYVPSSRPIGFFVRTTTAVTTSPFFTVPCGFACLTVAVITSPTKAYRRREPPFTRMHRISRAPELSATRRRVSFWIIALAPARPPAPSAWCATAAGSR